MRKKTYILDTETLKLLEEIKRKLGKKETQIVKEAIRLYYEHTLSERRALSKLEELVERLSGIIGRLEEKLGE